MSFKISAWVPYWQHDAAITTAEQNKDIVGDLLLFNWECHSDCSVKSLWYDPVPVDRLKKGGFSYWVTFVSAMNGAAAADIFGNTTKSKTLIKNMISVAKQTGAIGLDLDFESINFGHSGDSHARLTVNYPKFVALLKQTAGTLKVSVTVPARISDSIPDWSCYDYKELGAACDLIRIMAYDDHWSGGPAGPVADIRWGRKVMLYSKSKVPAGKTSFGIPAYGYDWPLVGNGKTIAARQADALAAKNGTKVSYQSLTTCEGTFSYSGRTVWVATSAGMAKRASEAKAQGFESICIWSLGDQPGDAFAQIRKAIGTSAPSPTPTPTPTPTPKPPTPTPIPTPTPKPPLKPAASLAAAQPGKKNNSVLLVQKALHQAVGLDYSSGPGTFGPKTKAAYAQWQKSLGYKGSAADGIPGQVSLKALGDKYGFRVIK